MHALKTLYLVLTERPDHYIMGFAKKGRHSGVYWKVMGKAHRKTLAINTFIA